MANGYQMNNLIKGAQSSISIGASETETVISDEIRLSGEDSKNFQINVVLSEVTEVTGISFDLQHSYGDGEWFDVGSQATVAVSSTLSTVADADVSSTNETITSTSHPFSTGDKVYYNSSAGNEITGLTDDTVYYAIDASANTFSLATTRALALAGTAIDITQPSGGDTHYFATPDPIRIILNIEESNDEAQLPLWPLVRVVANSGTSDTCTVSKVFVSRRL